MAKVDRFCSICFLKKTSPEIFFGEIIIAKNIKVLQSGIMSQLDSLKKLKNGEITTEEFFTRAEDPSIDKYKVTKEEFLKDERISDETKEHELAHAKVYEDEGIEVEFFYFGETNREACTSATKESLEKWLENKTRKAYIDLLHKVTSAPSKLGYTDKKILEILDS